MEHLMWYIPAGVLETIEFLIYFWVSWRLAKSLEICDKDLNQYKYVKSETTGWKGWTKIG